MGVWIFKEFPEPFFNKDISAHFNTVQAIIVGNGFIYVGKIVAFFIKALARY